MILNIGIGASCSVRSGNTPLAMPGVTWSCAMHMSQAVACCSVTACCSTSIPSRCESWKCREQPRGRCPEGRGHRTAFTDEARAALHQVVGDVSTCHIWSNLTTGMSATGRGNRTSVAAGSGATMRYRGSPTRTKRIEISGSSTPGIGCGSMTETASSRCPAAEFSTHRWATSTGTTPTPEAMQCRKDSARNHQGDLVGQREQGSDSAAVVLWGKEPEPT